MNKLTIKSQAYEAGAKAYTAKGIKAKNPHAADSGGCKSWEHGYLDRQKLRANADGEASRKRAISRLPHLH